MSKPRPSRSTPPSSAKPTQGRRLAITLALVVAAGLGAWSLLKTTRPPAEPATASSTQRAESGTNGVQEASSPNQGPDMRRAIGRWQRTDGDYVIQVDSVDTASGRLEAKYFNPQPIHVGRAEAKNEAGKLTVFVELQDVNYPGSTYRLTYFPATDQLFGTYYQAALDQSFEVEFGRAR